jgi:hypothetical protein
MEQRCGSHNFQISALSFCNPLSKAVDTQNMVKIVDRIGVLIPSTGFFNCDFFH